MKLSARIMALLTAALLTVSMLTVPALADDTDFDWDKYWNSYWGSSASSYDYSVDDSDSSSAVSANTSVLNQAPTTTATTTTASYSDFTDLPAGASYRTAVSYCLENGIMNGMGSGKFQPSTTLTRAMLVTILYRLEGSPEATYANTFKDISSSNSSQSWYLSAVAWAVSKNITTGYTDGTFMPTKAVSRQELAVFLARYAALKGYDTKKTKSCSGLTDAGTIGTWASSQVGWAYNYGVLEQSNGTLRPTAGATRAEVCTAVYAFATKIASAKAS